MNPRIILFFCLFFKCNFIPALPFTEMKSKAPLPNSVRYPSKLTTIGDHIKAWRLDNGLLQKDVAKILAVCEDSVTGWEVRGRSPSNKQIPGIIKIIGYFPIC